MNFFGIYKKIAKFFYIFLFLILFSFQSREFMTPLNYGIGLPYGKDLYRQNIPALESMGDGDEYYYEFYPSMTFYNRSMHKAYNSCDRNKTGDLSYLFHGADSFSVKDLFYNAKVPQDFSLDTSFDNITINPSYSYEEKGCVVGFGAQREQEIGGRIWNIRLHAHMPIKDIYVTNDSNYDAIEFDNLSVPTEISQNWFREKIDSKGNNTFAVRMDKLFDSKIINLQQGQYNKYFVISPNIQTNNNVTNNDLLSLSYADALSGYMIWKRVSDGSVGNFPYIPLTLSNVDNETFTIGNSKKGTNNVIINDAKSVIILNNEKDVITTYSLYKDTGLNKFPFINFTNNLVTEPINIGKANIKGNVFYNKNGDGIADPQKVEIKSLKNGDIISIFAFPKGGNNLEFTKHNIAIQYGDESFPENFAIELPTFTEHKADATTFVYNDYLADVSSLNKKYNIIKNDGSLLESDGATIATDSSLPAIFWYATDYTDLDTNVENLQKLYLTTAYDSAGVPTHESRNIQKEIQHLMLNESTNGIDDNLNSKELVKMFLKGWFSNGMTLVNDLSKPAHENAWDDYKKRGLGDVDLEMSFGSQFFDNKLAADIIIGAILPTSEIINSKSNYLAMPLGNNGHFEFRAGLESAYDINSWIRVSSYLSGSMAVSERENLITPFKGAKVFGLQPTTIDADVSWNKILASFDLSMFANDHTSMQLKYQFMYKTADDFSNYSKTAKDGVSEYKPVSFSQMQDFSRRESHKLIGSISTSLNSDFFINFGVSTIFAGKNIGQENDFFLTAIISY